MFLISLRTAPAIVSASSSYETWSRMRLLRDVHEWIDSLCVGKAAQQ